MSKLFGKPISQNGFGIFRTMLKYKLGERLKQLVVAKKFFASTQLCSSCGFKNQEVKGLNKLGIRTWICPHCGTEHDRDINAAKNLVNYYETQSTSATGGIHARGDCVRPETDMGLLTAVIDEPRKIKEHVSV